MGKNAKRRREVRDTTRIRGIDGNPKGGNRADRRRLNRVLHRVMAQAPTRPAAEGTPEPSPKSGPKRVGAVKDDRALADRLGFKRRPSGIYVPGGRGEK